MLPLIRLLTWTIEQVSLKLLKIWENSIVQYRLLKSGNLATDSGLGFTFEYALLRM